MEVNQNNLIKSLRKQPLIVVIRLEHKFLNISEKRENLLLKIERLSHYGIKNIEIGWDSNPEWINLILEIKKKFKLINLGVASISSRQSLIELATLLSSILISVKIL